MSNEGPAEKIDRILDLLSRTLSRYILSVLAGVDPGEFVDLDEDSSDSPMDRENIDL